VPHPWRANRQLIFERRVQARFGDAKADLPQELSLFRHEWLQLDEQRVRQI
jgi:hypothetical protein